MPEPFVPSVPTSFLALNPLKSQLKGSWPVMLTPYDKEHQIDWQAFEKLVEWYTAAGSQGLFASCLSSDLFQLTRVERHQLARRAIALTGGRLPVIASGAFTENVSSKCALLNTPAHLADEINCLADLGVSAVILLTNQLASPGEGDDIWLENLEATLARVRPDVQLGLYECPAPYKRLLTPALVRWAADTGRVTFIKDTCCDLAQIHLRLEAIASVPCTPLRLFNAHTATLLGSLTAGASGFSGVGSNAIPHLYSWICQYSREKPQLASELQNFLVQSSPIIDTGYPQSTQDYLNLHGFSIAHVSRNKTHHLAPKKTAAFRIFHSEVKGWERRLNLESPFIADFKGPE